MDVFTACPDTNYQHTRPPQPHPNTNYQHTRPPQPHPDTNISTPGRRNHAFSNSYSAAFKASARSVRSQVNSGSSRPKWP